MGGWERLEAIVAETTIPTATKTMRKNLCHSGRYPPHICRFGTNISLCQYLDQFLPIIAMRGEHLDTHRLLLRNHTGSINLLGTVNWSSGSVLLCASHITYGISLALAHIDSSTELPY